MLSRRSESCPRLARKESISQAPTTQQPLSAAPARSCTLQDLGPEDRQKVAKLLKQVVDLGQEVRQLKHERDELTQQAQVFAQREQELQEDKQQLHSEHHSLKRKLAQVLLVLRASQAKVAALEATHQATPVAHCAVEVQTEPIDIIDSEVQSSIASNVPACAVCSPVQPAVSTAAQPPGKAEPTGHADSATMHASLAIAPGGPPFLHVAPGAHVNITINHAPEPVTAAAATAVVVPASVASAAKPAGAFANKPLETGEAEFATDASPGSMENGCNKGVASTLSPHYGISEYGAVMASSPAAPGVITIPTTTAATTAAGPFCTVAVSAEGAGPGAEVAQLEASVGSCSAMCASPCGPINASMPTGPVQQAADAHSGVLAPTALPKARRAASTVAPTGSTASGKPTGPRNILVDATMQRFEAVPVHEVRVQSREILTASPMIVPPSDEVVIVASRLLGMQARHGLSSVDDGPCAAVPSSNTSREPRSGRKVLSFDPAIGQSGAFYFVDVPDMGADAAETLGATVVGPKHLNRNDVGSVASSRQPRPQHPADLPATSMSAIDRIAAASPQNAQQHLLLDSETTLRSWTDGLDASGCGRLGGLMGAPQHQHLKSNHRQHQQPGAEPTAPSSPCSSYTTETTSMSTPFLQCLPTPPPLLGNNDTPASSSMSLSRIAVALEEVARRQRWDVQAPSCTARSQETPALRRTVYPAPKVGDVKHLAGPGASVRQRGRGHGEVGTVGAFAAELGPIHGSCKFQDPHTAMGPALQLLRPGIAGLMTAAAAISAAAANTSSPLHASQDAASQLDALSTCGNTPTWMGAIDVADRYDDSLVDILSQADEELEYQQQQQQHQNHHEQHHWRPQGQRKRLQAAAMPLAGPVSVRSRGPVAPCPMSETVPTRLRQAASAEAILAANLYEENDVLSVIMEQEGRV